MVVTEHSSAQNPPSQTATGFTPGEIATNSCWINSATGARVRTGPPSWDPRLTLDHVTSPGGTNYVALPDGTWINSGTGAQVRTGPPSWDPRLTPDHVTSPGGTNYVRVPCPPPPTASTATAQPTPTPTPTVPTKSAGNALGYHVDSNAANGLYVNTFTTPQGKIKINLTNDLAAGDTISGTVEAEPAGKNDAERAQNQSELNGYVIELEGQKTKVGDKNFTCNIPTVLTPEAKTIVLQHNGQTVATTQIPISATPPPAPTQFTLPTGGQQGRPIVIHGPCDGVFSPNDSVKVGPTILPPVAKSPRSLVVLNTSDVIGPTTIDCNENGATMQCPFRNIGIKLSAPKLNLRRGETTTLHVVVSGLAGMTQSLPLNLANNSGNVIKMSGGEVQRSTINSAAVQRDGTYSIDRTLTGIMAGGFVVTGTVIWTDTCSKEGPGGVIAEGPGPVSQPTPSPTPVTPTDTVDGTICKEKVYKNYKPSEFKRVDSSDPKTLKVRSQSGSGGAIVVYYHCVGTGTYSTNFTVTKDDGTKDIVKVNCSP